MAPRSYAQDQSRFQTAVSEDAIVQQNASTYYAKKYGVDLKEAGRRIAIQDRAAGIDDDIANVLRDQFAGVWYDHTDAGKLKIGMTAAAMKHADEVRQIANRYGLTADMDLVPVAFTLAELEQKQDLIRKSLNHMVNAAHARTSYSTKENKVVLTLAQLTPSEEARVRDLAKIEGVFVRRVDKPTLRGVADSCNVTFCNAPFRGGRQIVSNGGSGCTGAFIARGRTSPTQNWTMTAGHCVQIGGTTWNAKDESNAFSLLGVTAFGHSAGHDSGIVSISTFGGWNSPAPKPFVIVKDSSTVPDDIIFTNYNPSYKITATSFSSMGQVLCRTGATTGTECGEVSDLGADESMAWPDGTTHTYHPMGNINVCGAKGGDSGGPYYKKHRAFGIHSGHNDCYEIYKGVRQAEADWNVKVVLEQ